MTDNTQPASTETAPAQDDPIAERRKALEKLSKLMGGAYVMPTALTMLVTSKAHAWSPPPPP